MESAENNTGQPVRDGAGRFVKGMKRPANSGRTRGVPNRWKREIYDDLLKRFADVDFDFVREFKRLYFSKRTNQTDRIRLYLGAAAIIFPKKLAVSSHSRIEHFDRTAAMDLMKKPEIAQRMEELTFLMGERPVGLLPAGDRKPGPIDAEWTDVSDGAGL